MLLYYPTPFENQSKIHGTGNAKSFEKLMPGRKIDSRWKNYYSDSIRVEKHTLFLEIKIEIKKHQDNTDLPTPSKRRQIYIPHNNS